jgi:hypothetical protein
MKLWMSKNWKWIWLGGLLTVTGCGADFQASILEAARQQSLVSHSALPNQELPEAEFDPPPANVNLPSPGRTNPFEMAGGFETNDVATDGGTEKKKEVRVLGFVELDQPTVMLAVDGQTELMRAGEVRDGIEILEIQTPQVKIKRDGVSWYASLFDPR